MQAPKKIIIIGGLILIALAAAVFFTLRKNGESGKSPDDFSVADPEIRAILEAGQPEEPYEETSTEKIDAAFADGKISPEKYALLSMSAVYSPEKLPAEFSGAADTEPDHAFLYAVIYENWGNFSEETKAALLPYLLPPTDPKSYFYEAAESGAKQSFLPKLFGASPAMAAGGDTEKLEIDAKTSVIYKKNASAAVKEHADWMRLAAAIAIPKFKDLLSINPNFIFIYPTGAAKIGRAYGDAELLPDAGGVCEVRIKDNLDFIKTSATVAHEIFHCFQNFYGFKYLGEMKWFMEATAVWSEDFIFPTQRTEHEYDDSFLDHMPWDLLSQRANRHYGSYLWFFYLVQKNTPETIAYIFQRIKENNSKPRQALETLPDFNDAFKEFVFWDWNYKPYQYFQDSPYFPEVHPNGGSRQNKMIKNPGNYPAEVALDKGAAKYYIYGFSGDKVKFIKFDLEGMGIDNDNKTTAVQALYKVKDSWYYEDWTGLKTRSFCRDLDGENIDGLIAIVSNSDLNQNLFGGYGLEVKNKCNPGWRGAIKVNWSMNKNQNPQGTWRVTEKGSYSIAEELEYDSERDSIDIKTSTFTASYASSEIIRGKATDCTPYEAHGSNIAGAAIYVYIKNNTPDGHRPSRFYGTEVLEPGKFGGTYSLGLGIPDPPVGSPNPLRGTVWDKKIVGDCPLYILTLPNLFGHSSNTVEPIQDPTIYSVNPVDITIAPGTKRVKGSDKFEIHTGVWGTVEWDYQKID